MRASDTPGEMEVGLLTGEIARELRVLAEDMEELQTTLSDLFRGVTPGDDLVVRAQALDRAFQSLNQLSQALEGVASVSDPSWTVPLGPILQPISLRALALRLAGQTPIDTHSCDLELL